MSICSSKSHHTSRSVSLYKRPRGVRHAKFNWSLSIFASAFGDSASGQEAISQPPAATSLTRSSCATLANTPCKLKRLQPIKPNLPASAGSGSVEWTNRRKHLFGFGLRCSTKYGWGCAFSRWFTCNSVGWRLFGW